MYLSTAAIPEAWSAEALQALGHRSELRNQRLGVTGFLLFSTPFFFQALEGPPEVIQKLMATISSDPRHMRCIILADVLCTEHIYGDWHMKVADIGTIIMHPAISTALTQIACIYTAMWSYLPKPCGKLLLQGKDPNKEPPQVMTAAVAFIKIVEFDAMLQQPTLRQHLASIVEAFVDCCVKHTQATGGLIAKFFHGGCMVYWPSDKVADAVLGLSRVHADITSIVRKQPSGSALSLLAIQAGVHFGEAVVCNAGAKKADFTLLGPSVNVAPRLAALAARESHCIVTSQGVKDLVHHALGDPFTSIGHHQLKGLKKPMHCFALKDARLETATVRGLIQDFTSSLRMSIIHAPCPVRRMEEVIPADVPMTFESTSPGYTVTADKSEKTFVQNIMGRMKTLLPASPKSDSRDVINVREKRVAIADRITLTYVSRSLIHMSRADLEALQRESYRYNDSQNIRGALMYLNGIWLQTLEGSQKSVLEIFRKIKADPRHTDVVAVHTGPTESDVCSAPLELTVVTPEQLREFPPLQEVLVQLARSFFSLETYVPTVIMRHLITGADPRHLRPTTANVIMLASDLCSFTALCEGGELADVRQLCTTFIDCCTTAIGQEGGEVLKLIGDCVTAYFLPSAAAAALRAAQRIVRTCARWRASCRNLRDPRLAMHCGVGIDYGPVVMAHCGTLGTIEYTVMGQVTGRVMEVESLTREAGSAIVMTQPIADRVGDLRPQSLGREAGGAQLYRLEGSEWELDPSAVTQSVALFHQRVRSPDRRWATVVDGPNPAVAHAPTPPTSAKPSANAPPSRPRAATGGGATLSLAGDPFSPKKPTSPSTPSGEPLLPVGPPPRIVDGRRAPRQGWWTSGTIPR